MKPVDFSVSPLASALVRSIMESMYSIVDYIKENEEGQKGGVLCVYDSRTRSTLLLCVFGYLTAEEIEEYTYHATEKARRLATSSGDITSWQSRDMNTTPKRYGGAVSLVYSIFSFSGFTEEQDEAAMLVLSMNTGLLNGGAAALLAQISKNQYFRKLQNACSIEGREHEIEMAKKAKKNPLFDR